MCFSSFIFRSNRVTFFFQRIQRYSHSSLSILWKIDKQTHDRIKGAQMIGVHLNNPIFPDLYLSTPSVETNSLQHKRPSQMNIGSKQMLSDSSSVSTNSRHDAVARQNELHPSMLFEDIHITTVNQQSSLTTEQILASIHRTLDPFTDLLSMISISPDLFFRRELIQFCKEYSIAICIDDNDCSLSNVCHSYWIALLGRGGTSGRSILHSQPVSWFHFSPWWSVASLHPPLVSSRRYNEKQRDGNPLLLD